MGNVFFIAALGVGGLVATFGVRKLLVGGLNVYRKASIFWLKLKGSSPEKEAEKRLVTGQAWEEWCDTLKAAGGVLLSPGSPTDPFSQAEGYRYLSRLVRASLEAFMESSDTNAPKLFAIADGSRNCPIKLGSDNPDNVYLSASISGKKEYIVSVKRGTVKYLGFGSQAGTYGAPGGLETVDYKEAAEFEIGEDGSFEIFLGNHKPDGMRNWLKTVSEPERGLLIVRQTREDHEGEILAQVEIKCLTGEATPSVCSAEAVEEALRTSSTFVAGAPILFARWAHQFQKHTNQLPLFDPETSRRVGGDPNIRYYHSYWKVLPDEALVIWAHPPVVETWNFQLNNHWMESLDYRYFNIHVNQHTAKCHESGLIVIVVTSLDPHELAGASSLNPFNWIQTANHTFGTMSFRWIRPKVSDEGLPAPATCLVKRAGLVDHLKGLQQQ